MKDSPSCPSQKAMWAQPLQWDLLCPPLSCTEVGTSAVAPPAHSFPASASPIGPQTLPPLPAEDTLGVSSQNLTFLWCVKIC